MLPAAGLLELSVDGAVALADPVALAESVAVDDPAACKVKALVLEVGTPSVDCEAVSFAFFDVAGL